MSKARGLADLGNVYNDGALSNRNLIINGAMQVAQRGTSSTTSGLATVDRFICGSAFPTITQSQNSLTSSDTPYASGFRKSYRATVTTASSSATSYVQISQNIEAQNVAQSGWNYTDPSSYVTLSFWAKSSLAGTYYSQFRTHDTTAYYYNKSFTLSADTWTQVTCTVSGNANLVIDNDNGTGLSVIVIPDYGTDYSGHAEAVEDAWYARTQVSGYTPSFVQDWRNTAGATFEVTGVQLEVGDTATPFEHRIYGDELARCQRYCVVYENGTALAGNASNTTTFSSRFQYPVVMRAKPSASRVSGTDYRISDDFDSDKVAATLGIGSITTSDLGCRLALTGFSGLTTGRTYAGVYSPVQDAKIMFDAEL